MPTAWGTNSSKSAYSVMVDLPSVVRVSGATRRRVSKAADVPTATDKTSKSDPEVVDEDTTESLSILATHRAIENKVYGAVDENQKVPEVSERHVDAVEDGLIDRRQQRDDALR